MTLDNSIAIIPLKEYEKLKEDLKEAQNKNQEDFKKLLFKVLDWASQERLLEHIRMEVPGHNSVFNVDTAEYIWNKVKDKV